MSWVKYLNKDQLAGALMVVIGLGAVYFARPLALGTLVQMGPAFFPSALGVILACLGLAIAFGSIKRSSTAAELLGEPAEIIAVHEDIEATSDKPDWRGWSCILVGFIAFIVLFTYAGAVPAATALVVISAFGERGNNWKSAIGLAAFANVVLVVVFRRALQMPLHLFWWD
jgi:hypothetical protein